MNDSNGHEDPSGKLGRNHEQRIEGIKRWVEYIKSTPPETWGPQQNAVVDGQLDAARSVQESADNQQHVKNVAGAIFEAKEKRESDSE
ncbi:MAG: hypothetical protein ABEJ84_04625 [Halodesulfurarchaeum sp.]